MNWSRGALLTDSGGFQMVSLQKLSRVSEEGVHFQSPHDQSELLLTPEESIRIQNCIGSCFQFDMITYILHAHMQVLI